MANFSLYMDIRAVLTGDKIWKWSRMG